MAEQEQVTTETPAPTEAPKEEPQLKTLSSVEQVVNDYAMKRAREWKTGLKEGDFVVLLARKFGGIMGLKRGRPVQIILLWPDAQTEINRLLKDAFRTINKHRMVDCWAVESSVAIRSRKLESKKWRREKFGDEAEIIGELIPRRDIIVDTSIETRVCRTIRDQHTGVTIEKMESSKVTKHTDGRDIDVSTWLELSRMARDVETETETRLQETSDAEFEAAAQALREAQLEGKE